MKTAVIDYTNWRGERRNRRIRPTGLAFTSNEYHAQPCWMLLARDLDSNEDRTFPLQSIHRWEDRDG
jgi:predicted DNA-binding transcriptional regulator YafY